MITACAFCRKASDAGLIYGVPACDYCVGMGLFNTHENRMDMLAIVEEYQK